MGDDGHGTTVTFGTSGFAANIISIDGPAVVRDAIDTTHMGSSTAKSAIPADVYDAGEMTMTVEHDASLTVPMSGAVETITIAWAGGANTWAFSGFMTGYTPNAESGSRMEAVITIKATGEITGL